MEMIQPEACMDKPEAVDCAISCRISRAWVDLLPQRDGGDQRSDVIHGGARALMPSSDYGFGRQQQHHHGEGGGNMPIPFLVCVGF